MGELHCEYKENRVACQSMRIKFWISRSIFTKTVTVIIEKNINSSFIFNGKNIKLNKTRNINSR